MSNNTQDGDNTPLSRPFPPAPGGKGGSKPPSPPGSPPASRWKPPAQPTERPAEKDPRAKRRPKREGSSTTEKGSKGSSGGSGRSRTAKDAVGASDAKADRQRQRAAAAGRTIAESAGGNADDKRLAGEIGENLSDMKNAEGLANKAKAARGAAEGAARMVANKKTGGVSEKVLNSGPGKVVLKVARVAAAAQMLLPLMLVSLLVLSAVVVIAAVTGGGGVNSDIKYTLDDTSSLAIDDPYLTAYQDAGTDHDVPWTVLAGIGQVATEHGRYAPSDITDQGILVDRAPHRDPIGSFGGASSASGKYAPPLGTTIAVLGDSFVAGARAPTEKTLSGYDLRFAGENGATIEDVSGPVAEAAASAVPIVVIQAGVNDIVHSATESVYRAQIRSVLDSASATQCTVWVNLQVFYAGDYGHLGPAAQRFNTVLLEEAATRPWVSVADLATATAVAGMQSTDGLHLSGSGYRAWAEVVARTVQSCVRGRPAPTTDAQGNPIPQEPVEPTAAVPATADRVTASGQPVKVDASYGSFVCADGVCGPYPRIGQSEGTPMGPFQLKREFVERYADGRSPDDVAQAADMLAEELDRIRDEALAGPAAELFAGWRNDVVVSRQLWSYVVSKAPVVLPAVSNLTASACSAGPVAGPQGATFAWPLASPTAVSEFGSAVQAGEQVQLTGMVLSSASKDVLASGAGAVSDIGVLESGSFVVLAHGEGFSTRYERLVEVSVAIGDTITAGARLGSVDGSLLFQTAVGSSPRNPRLYVADASSLALAAGTATDPQGSSSADDPQAGVPVDPCTGLRLLPAVSAQELSGTTTTGGVPTSLVMPAAGVLPSQIYDSFGAPRSGGRKHQGIDIIIPVGVPLVAVTEAVVFDANAGGQPCPTTGDKGKAITLKDASGNHYYYGHMDTIAVQDGQSVSPGQFLGTSGATGNACVSVPHLHFSINEGTDKVVNPYPILSGARSLQISDFASALGADALSRLTGLNSLNGAADYAIAFATFYGGVIASDPDAGTFPGTNGSFGSTSPTGPSGAELAATAPEVAAIIRLYFPQEQWDNAIRVANCESGLNPGSVSAPNTNGTRDYGLFQFNDGGTLQAWLERTGEDPRSIDKALDPHWSARAAALKVATDTNWGAWSCAHTPYGKRTYGLSIVSVSPKTRETGEIDYSWQESGTGDTSRQVVISGSNVTPKR